MPFWDVPLDRLFVFDARGVATIYFHPCLYQRIACDNSGISFPFDNWHKQLYVTLSFLRRIALVNERGRQKEERLLSIEATRTRFGRHHTANHQRAYIIDLAKHFFFLKTRTRRVLLNKGGLLKSSKGGGQLMPGDGVSAQLCL